MNVLIIHPQVCAEKAAAHAAIVCSAFAAIGSRYIQHTAQCTQGFRYW